MCTHWFFAISQIGLTMRNAKYRLFGLLVSEMHKLESQRKKKIFKINNAQCQIRFLPSPLYFTILSLKNRLYIKRELVNEERETYLVNCVPMCSLVSCNSSSLLARKIENTCNHIYNHISKFEILSVTESRGHLYKLPY
jgi:hypothetical protein